MINTTDAIGISESYSLKSQKKYGIIDGMHMHGDLIGWDDEKGIHSWQPTPLERFPQTKEDLTESWIGYAFNSKLSASLPLDRPIPTNLAPKACPGVISDSKKEMINSNNIDYDSLRGSVVIVFHNEDLSVLLRSVQTILNRTPEHMLREIILVDDDSNGTTHPWLKDELDYHLQFLPKTRVRRLDERHGLMMARVAGAEWARSEILIFFDSHIEVSDDWYFPLIAPIIKDPKTITVPAIPGIDNESFKHSPSGITGMSHTWTLGQFHTSDKTKAPHENQLSPAMAGGLFATNRHFFMDQLGGYDSEMRLYGGEEFELGFKAWMCGGQIMVVPCSRVYHIFRTNKHWSGQVYKVPGHEIHRNKRRVAWVWMDEYKELALSQIGDIQKSNPIGDMENQVKIRETCNNGKPSKTFKWYMENVATMIWAPTVEELVS